MATARKRKRALPPWLSGVEVNNRGQPVKKNVDESDGAKESLATSSTPALGKSDPMKKESPLEAKDTGLSSEQVVALSYPKFVFSGAIVYSYNKDDCNLLCDDLLSEMDSSTDSFVGFDTEWPVTYEKGKRAKTALIQICPSVNKCYLFHVSCMSGFPSMLKKLIETKSVKKVGLNIEYDLWKLETDYGIRAKDIIQTSAVELRTLANSKLRSAENWSLEGLAKNVLQVRISKDPNVRRCDWSQFPLPEEQQLYAASDAVVSLMLYLKLIDMGKRGKQTEL